MVSKGSCLIFICLCGCNSGPKDGGLEKDELAGVVGCNSGTEDGGCEKDEFSGNSGPENCVSEKGEVPVSNCGGGEDGAFKDDWFLSGSAEFSSLWTVLYSAVFSTVPRSISIK